MPVFQVEVKRDYVEKRYYTQSTIIAVEAKDAEGAKAAVQSVLEEGHPDGRSRWDFMDVWQDDDSSYEIVDGEGFNEHVADVFQWDGKNNEEVQIVAADVLKTSSPPAGQGPADRG